MPWVMGRCNFRSRMYGCIYDVRKFEKILRVEYLLDPVKFWEVTIYAALFIQLQKFGS
jgi:hypothetical protein